MNKAKPEVIIWPPAFRDMEDIFDYIRIDNADAAGELLQEFHEKIATLADHPKLYKKGRVPGTREMVVRSSYVVVYKETSKVITVLRVFHAARKWA